MKCKYFISFEEPRSLFQCQTNRDQMVHHTIPIFSYVLYGEDPELPVQNQNILSFPRNLPVDTHLPLRYTLEHAPMVQGK